MEDVFAGLEAMAMVLKSMGDDSKEDNVATEMGVVEK